MQVIITKPFERWDTLANKAYNLPELAWAIAEANPELAENLILPAGIEVLIPDLIGLRRALTAANPAREDSGQFLPLPPNTPKLAPESPGGDSGVTYPIPINKGGTGKETAAEALTALGAIPASFLNTTIPTLGSNGIISSNFLPAIPAATPNPLPINMGGTGQQTAALALTALGGIPSTALGLTIPTLGNNGIILPAFLPTIPPATPNPLPINMGGTGEQTAALGLAALGGVNAAYVTSAVTTAVTNYAVALTSVGAPSGVVPLGADLKVAPGYLNYPTLASLGAVGTTGNQTVDGDKSFTGFTALGDVAFKKKMLKGNTASTQGAGITVAHGVNSSKIRNVSGLIFYTATGSPDALPNDMPSVPVPGRQAGFACTVNISSTNVTINNDASSSGSILSRPFFLMIEYVA